MSPSCPERQAWPLRGLIRIAAAALVLLVAAVTPVYAQGSPDRLAGYIRDVVPGELVPGANRLVVQSNERKIGSAYDGDKLVGYVYLTSDFVPTTGYSGKPIHVLVGLDTEGTIVGAKLVEHHEPIVLIGIPEARIVEFMSGYFGFNPIAAARTRQAGETVSEPTSGKRARVAGPTEPEVDIVSGATVTVLVIGDSLTRSAARVARAIGLGGAGSSAPAAASRELDPTAGGIADWEALLGDGSVRRLHVTVGEVNEAFLQTGDERAHKRRERGSPEETFIDLYVGLVSHPSIGKSLLGESEYENVRQFVASDRHAILVAADGRYSFKGSGYVRGGVFDRIELVQGLETIRFRDRDHRRIAEVAAAGAPRFREVDVFAIPKDADFDPAAPWQLRLLVQRSVGALERAFVTFDVGYAIPEQYLRPLPPARAAETEQPAISAAGDAGADMSAASLDEGEIPLWQRIWESKTVSIGVLVLMLAVLTAIFFFQDFLVRREKLFDRIRLIYLAVTLFWLGWVAQAQLSVVNVLTFASALRSDFQWSYFMMDPLIFILWFAVAAALLFWGRGPFCGWLCPFGALQELANRGARALKVPQLKIPWAVHERMWPIKYMIFLILFGVSLGSLALAEQLAEVEPFKTAIILRFVREWWFVLFAAALIVAGLFVERFFCRYLCPLGAALAIPGRLRMFDWLKRYRECGNPCMRCFNECPVEAIHPEGHINPNECISCLHCQVLYHHDRKCPVVIQRRIKKEKREALASAALRPVAADNNRTISERSLEPADAGMPATHQ